MEPELNIDPAIPADADMLADIRVESMRPSLEAINRFDPIRARNRFLSTFSDTDTFIFYLQDQIAGFYVLRVYPDHLYLDHLYIKGQFQGRGLGRNIIEVIKAHAISQAKPIRLIALKGSPANNFYLALGFNFEQNEDVDNYYSWDPATFTDLNSSTFSL